MKKANITDIAENFARLIPIFGQKVIEPFEDNIKNVLSPLTMNTLLIISKKEFITMTELAKYLNVLRPQLTPIVDKLIKYDYVERESDPNDRRIVRIKITQSGIIFVKKVHKNAVDNAKKRIETFSNEDLLLLEESLNNLYRLIEKM